MCLLSAPFLDITFSPHAVLRSGTILYHKNIGLVSEVFNSAVLSKLPQAKMAIGHVRYSTTGTNSKQNTQPMVTE